jgi:hypothetical protein
MMMAEIDPDKHHWWSYGNYTGEDCPHCGRRRLMLCEDNQGNERIICEKCNWEPAINDYRFAHPTLDGGEP